MAKKKDEPKVGITIVGNPDAPNLKPDRALEDTEIVTLIAEWADSWDIKKTAKRLKITPENALLHLSLYAPEDAIDRVKRGMAFSYIEACMGCVRSILGKLESGELWGKNAAITAEVLRKGAMSMLDAEKGKGKARKGSMDKDAVSKAKKRAEAEVKRLAGLKERLSGAGNGAEGCTKAPGESDSGGAGSAAD